MIKSYKQLSLEERRNNTKISDDLRRNHFKDVDMPKVVGYFGVVASMKALSRRQKDRKLMRHSELRELIIERIKDGWTPEQIAGRLIYENAPIRVC
jgi:IS30 family transposase